MKAVIVAITGCALITSGAICPGAERALPSAGRQPLTFANAVSFFRKALGRSPLKVDERCVLFAEGEWTNKNNYQHSIIAVENADEDLEITFIMTGDEGMNWVNEFFDSQFFARGETESLFRMLNSVHGTRRAKVGRFMVEFSRWQPHHHEIVVVSLSRRAR